MSAQQKEGVANAFLKYRGALHRYLLRFVPSPDTAEDLVQDTFVKAYAAATGETDASAANSNERSTRNYLFTTARHLAIDHHRRFKTQVCFGVADVEDCDVRHDYPAVDDQVISRQELELLCEAIAQLPARSRRVFTLRKVYDLSHREIADQLGITVSTAQNHLGIATKLVTEYLEALDRSTEKLNGPDEASGVKQVTRSRHD